MTASPPPDPLPPTARPDAEALLCQALTDRPDDPALHNDLGNALLAKGDAAAAIACYRAALARAPGLAALHFNLANALVADGGTDAAMAAFGQALAIDPGHAGAYQNAGNLLRSLGRPVEAADSYLRALHLSPADASLRYNMGVALLDQHRPEEALTWFEQAAGAARPHPPAFASAGEALLRLGRPEQALAWFRQALMLNAQDTAARFGQAVALLTLGQYREGWRDFEARLADPRIAAGLPRFDAPAWDGTQPVAGRTILLAAEQGNGDTIQFARYAALLRDRGADVVLQVQRGLVGLMGGLADLVIDQQAPPPPFDLHCPLMSLPRGFGTELATVPDAVPYLVADPVRVEAWRRRLPDNVRPRIGIAWSGNADHMMDHLRSIPAALLRSMLTSTPCSLHLLQTEIRPSDADAAHGFPGLHDHTADLVDFADTAALISLMDLVITVDTSVAHLSGALGKPTWILLPFSADFRWLRDRANSPWYPTARLFRQESAGDWRSAIETVAGSLAMLCAGNRAWQHHPHARTATA